MNKESGDIRHKYKSLYVIVLIIGWTHIVLGCLGFVYFSLIEKKPVESSLFFYMIIAGYALLKMYSTVRKYENRISELTFELENKS